ncbi:hypothetical protein FNYG_14100 [Fusarium nygamai]|uniref:Uncharacterized protein n=1 Tax=Gibberella nygamai TaxID=42673 RepID=A0A2K0UTS2_GIBNY|nr:hypothetical protein FNYG_14100 [Fusarium nygamai]
MPDTIKPSTQSDDDNDNEWMSLFDTFYDAHQSQHISRPEYERILASLARATRSDSSTELKLLLNKLRLHTRPLPMSSPTSSGKTERLRYFENKAGPIDEARPAAERRQSGSNADNVKCDRHAYIRNKEKYQTNTLSQDIDLSVQIHEALLDEKQTGKALLAAKARVHI